MAKFEGIKWAVKQMRYLLAERDFDLFDGDDRVYAVSRSIHYGLFLTFEGIRFFCKKDQKGQLNIIFLNWHDNLERLRRGIAFNLSQEKQNLVLSVDELENLFIHHYFKSPEMRQFLSIMAENNAQGYLRPFTVDEEQSIGVTFPGKPSIRAVACSYERYLGEPFSGVVVPNLVRAVGANGTGCLKLGINYLMSVKAIDEAKKIYPEAASALFLDDQTHLPLEKRYITEWDSSCCLFAYKDGTVVKIPESNLILPSVTIKGITALLKENGIKVVERHISYGELLSSVKSDELAVVCSVGTAGILNRCQKLILVDTEGKILATHNIDQNNPIYGKLGEAKQRYWELYQEKSPLPPGTKLYKYII